jgi:serine/threonine protein kinase
LKGKKSIANSVIGKYIIYELLGRGSFGAVYRGSNDQTKEEVAVKVLDLEEVEKDPNPNVR